MASHRRPVPAEPPAIPSGREPHPGDTTRRFVQPAVRPRVRTLGPRVERVAGRRRFRLRVVDAGPKDGCLPIGAPWKDYDLVDEGKAARNKLAHAGKLLGKDD